MNSAVDKVASIRIARKVRTMEDAKKSDNLERIFITNDPPELPVGSDESARRPDPFLSPPEATNGSFRDYIIIAAVTAVIGAAGVMAYHYFSGPDKPAYQTRQSK